MILVKSTSVSLLVIGDTRPSEISEEAFQKAKNGESVVEGDFHIRPLHSLRVDTLIRNAEGLSAHLSGISNKVLVFLDGKSSWTGGGQSEPLEAGIYLIDEQPQIISGTISATKQLYFDYLTGLMRIGFDPKKIPVNAPLWLQPSEPKDFMVRAHYAGFWDNTIHVFPEGRTSFTALPGSSVPVSGKGVTLNAT